MDPASSRVVNRHVAQAPGSMEPSAVTQTMSPTHGHVNVHSGPEVQHFGHAIVGDGVPISDVREGRITVPGASYNSITDGGHHLHQHIHGHEHHHHHPHHTPDGAAISDPPKDFVHDGTTYATGATGEPYTDDDTGDRPGLMTRIKEAIPGTREHKQKVAQEDSLAVYM